MTSTARDLQTGTNTRRIDGFSQNGTGADTSDWAATGDKRNGHRSSMSRGFGTRAIHSGESLEPSTGALGTPLYQNSTYGFRSAEHVAAWQNGDAPHFVYARDGNPTVRCLELKLADLEGAESATVGASGMAAISATIQALTPTGSHVVASDALYSITRTHFDQDLPCRGVSTSFVDMSDLDAVRGAMSAATTVVYVETFSNPLLCVSDIPALAEIAHANGAKLVVDNTFLSPALYLPLTDGADVVIHSATKYLCGHGNALGGVVAGNDDVVRSIGGILVRTGGELSAFNAWMILAGVKTLALRIQRHVENAAQLAVLCSEHAAVATVHYPGLPSDPGYTVARRLLGANGPCTEDACYGGMLSLGLQGGEDARRRFLNALDIATIAVSLGECETLVWPVGESDIIRVSTGLEDSADLVADFRQALDVVASS